MDELLYKEDVFQLVGLCMEIHRELGKGHDEIIYKDALVVELSRAGIPFVREKNYEMNYLAASKLRLGLLVNFGGDSLEWKRVVL